MKKSKNPDKPWKPAIPKPPGWKPSIPLPRCQGWSKQEGRQCENARSKKAPGLTLCRIHGGDTGHLLLARKREAIIAEVDAAMGDIPPLVENPYEVVAQHGAEVFHRAKVLRERVGDLKTADVATPLFSAYERADREAKDYGIQLVKSDIDVRRLRVSEVQQNKLFATIRPAHKRIAQDIKNGLPASYHQGVDRAFAQFPLYLKAELEGTMEYPRRELEAGD